MQPFRVEAMKFDFLDNGSKYSFEDLMRPCNGSVLKNVKKILIAEPYINRDLQMHSLSQSLIAIFQLTHGERAAKCEYLLYTKRNYEDEMDNCDPYNPYLKGEKPLKAKETYQNIVRKSWDIYQKTCETKTVEKRPVFKIKTGHMHDRSITILCEGIILRYDLGTGLNILLDCTCLDRKIANNHYEGKTKFKKEPKPHNIANCGIEGNNMLSIGFNRPNRLCQVIKTTILPHDDNLDEIFEKFRAYSDPPLFNKKDYSNCNGIEPQIVGTLVSRN